VMARWSGVVRKAGLDPRLVHPQALRRTAITSLVMAGVDLPAIMRISGHKHTRVLMRYVHLSGATSIAPSPFWGGRRCQASPKRHRKRRSPLRRLRRKRSKSLRFRKKA
jgi:hypothetical protein